MIFCLSIIHSNQTADAAYWSKHVDDYGKQSKEDQGSAGIVETLAAALYLLLLLAADVKPIGVSEGLCFGGGQRFWLAAGV